MYTQTVVFKDQNLIIIIYLVRFIALSKNLHLYCKHNIVYLQGVPFKCYPTVIKVT